MRKKFTILFINFRKNFLSIIFFLFTLFLIIFSNSNILAVKTALNIWVNNVVPSLFPFFIATELLNSSNIPQIIGNLFDKIMRPLFNVPGIGAYAFFMGIISGYPVGAKIVTDFRNNKLCSKEEAERLITFTNNSGPLFIIGTIGISLFYDTSIGLLLLLTHIMSCITVGVTFRFWKSKNSQLRNSYSSKEYLTLTSLGSILSKSIISAINSILLIGGFIILFGIFVTILQKIQILSFISLLLEPLFKFFNINTNFITPIITGIIELTNGVSLVSLITSKNLSINVIICAFLLGFGGISIMLQVLSIISKSDISIKPYILGKLLQGTFASFYTYIIIYNFQYFSYLFI